MQNEMEYRPAASPLMTRWAADLNPNCPLPEYPRPQLERPDWLNLNGLWDYAITPAPVGASPSIAEQPAAWEGKILVPFAVEAALSGVGRALRPDQRLWYRRSFTAPAGAAWQKGRVLLRFGAVDWKCVVWLNGVELGQHIGGYLPFAFEAQDAWRADGENELVVCVEDPTDAGLQERGKQVLKPDGIWYTAISGIWQTVWLEPVAPVSIEQLRLTPDLDAGKLLVDVDLRGNAPAGASVTIEARAEGRIVALGVAPVGKRIELGIPEARAWSPDDPFLYDIKVRLAQSGEDLDQVDSYFAMRKFSVGTDDAGYPRFCLNNRPLFLVGPLDQGYFPDGLYTAPTDEALRFDLEYCKRLGLNMVRKHIKVEPLRWYAHCDRLGLIVWQDMPNGGLAVDGNTSTLAMHFGLKRDDCKKLERAGRADPENRNRYRVDLKGMADHLYNCPSVGVWVPFNEAWGQFHAREIGDWLRAYDPTRLVDSTSGWFDQGGGDFDSRHSYVLKLRGPRKKGERVFVFSEFGGYSWLIPGRVWDEKRKFGYKFYRSSAELTAAYTRLIERELKPLISTGLSAAIYTELTDVEIEINGYLTYDRAVEKMDSARLAALHKELTTSLDGG